MKSKNIKDKLKNSRYKKGKVLKAKANILRAFLSKKIILKSKAKNLRIYFNGKNKEFFYKKKLFLYLKLIM